MRYSRAQEPRSLGSKTVGFNLPQHSHIFCSIPKLLADRHKHIAGNTRQITYSTAQELDPDIDQRFRDRSEMQFRVILRQVAGRAGRIFPNDSARGITKSARFVHRNSCSKRADLARQSGQGNLQPIAVRKRL